MTAKYFAILTNYGAAQLANAVALGTKLNISVMAVGDGGGVLPIPNPAQTKLIRENRRAAVNQVSVDDKNPNYIISEQVIPENEGGWFIREIGLFDDKGGLIAVGNAPETYKPNLQEGSGRTQVIQMVLMVSSTESITLKVDPSVVLATREYVTKSIAAAIQESEAKAAKTYQPIGDYVLHPYLRLEMLKKFDKADVVNQLGNDTSKAASQNLVSTELGKKAPSNVAEGKLDKTAVVQAVGVSTKDVISQKAITDELNKKFDKTGGVITATSKAIDIETESNKAGYIQISDKAGNIIHQMGKLSSDNGLTLRNIAGGGSLVVSGDGIRFNNKLLGFLNEVSAGGSGWWRDNSTGLLIQWGSTPPGSTARDVSFPVPFLYAPYVIIHFDGGWHSAANGSKWGALNKSKTGFTAMTDIASEGGAYLTLGM